MVELASQNRKRGHVKLQPLGDRAILVVFGTELQLNANRQAIQFTKIVEEKLAPLIIGANSNLLSCLVRYDPKRVAYATLQQELQMLLASFDLEKLRAHENNEIHHIDISYGGADGPDFEHVHTDLKLSAAEFIEQHTALPLDVLALGFSPGFVYLGLHENWRNFPRRNELRENVPPGSVLFAAGQTAITSVPIRTGWSVIGHCDLNNFDLHVDPPVKVKPGDFVELSAKEQEHE
jgi:KipI family sensor histidine kinase inhibitor